MAGIGTAHASVPVSWISVDRAEGDPNHLTSHVGDLSGGFGSSVSGAGYTLLGHEIRWKSSVTLR
jgi:hypothetical protein